MVCPKFETEFLGKKTGGLQKKRPSPKLSKIFRPKSEIQTIFQPKNKWSQKKKKKKKKKKKRSTLKLSLIFRPKSEIQTLFHTESSSSYLFIYQVTSYHKKKTATSSGFITKASKYAIPLKPNTQTCRIKAIFSHLVRRQRRTERSSKSTATKTSTSQHDIYITSSTSTSQLRHPISFGGGCFQFFTKNRPKKQQKRAILHTSQANGGTRAPPHLRYWFGSMLKKNNFFPY